MPREFIKGKGVGKTPTLIEIENVDTGCEHCFAPADKVYYNKDKRTLLVICTNGHESNIEGNWSQILGLES